MTTVNTCYETSSLRVLDHGEGILEMQLDLADSSVNKLGRVLLGELEDMLPKVQRHDGLRALIISSGKKTFCVGADISEFVPAFSQPEEAMLQMLHKTQALYNQIEDLPVPTVAAIEGDCMGGGTELALACDFRVLSSKAKMALPEVKLGIMPGWGGTVRLPRLIGLDTALEWMATGDTAKADKALKEGVADAVVSPERLSEAAQDLATRAAAGEFDWQARAARKCAPLALSKLELTLSEQAARGVVASKAGPHYPAPGRIIDTVVAQAPLSRDSALLIERQNFTALTRTPVCHALIGIFLKDQAVKRIGKQHEKQAQTVQRAAVLGAGIMGGGIAYQSASCGVSIVMKDIAPQAIERGLQEASTLVGKQAARGKMDMAKAAAVLNAIHPALSYGEFATVDLAVEAVTENPKVKGKVLAEAEAAMREDAILTSNTSTISITQLAESLKRPEQFCGLHFFNPVHRMPLVEVIRGEKSSDQTIATAVAYARQLRKTPVVVNDCPGFLVNRVLFPYFGAFTLLLREGVDYQRIDKVMEKFGWPMGPAYLADVIGLDTMHHAAGVLAAGFPDRMQGFADGPLETLFQAGRLGQKNAEGFYRYETDKRGKLQKRTDDAAEEMIRASVTTHRELDDQSIVLRLMAAMCLECVRCLQDNIVSSAEELDMALIYGVGFPPHHGGACHYMDALGLDRLLAFAEQHSAISPLYQPPELLRQMVSEGRSFFPLSADEEAKS